MLINLISLNPPVPSSWKDESNECIEGKKLLNLLKSLERTYKSSDCDEDISLIEAKVLEILSSMETKFLRTGLLQKNQKKAQDMYNIIQSDRRMSQANVDGGKKRKRCGASGSSGSISSILNLENGVSTSEEAYVVSNLCKVLMSPSTEGPLKYPTVVIAAAAKVFFVICEHCKNHLSTLTSSIEHSMINSISSHFLNGMTKTMQKLLITTSEPEDKCDDIIDALQNSCLGAATVIMLSNISLSRNTVIIETLQKTCDDILLYAGQSEESTNLFEAAAILTATIPLAGSSSGFTAGQLWSEKLSKSMNELRSTILHFFPLARLSKRKKFKAIDGGTSIPLWILELKNATMSQSDRMTSFVVHIKIYIHTAIHLIKMNGYDISQNSNGVAVPITSILDCCEQLLHFASIAETKYLSTKNNLRDIAVEGGLLSPSAAVTIANSIKYLGCELFQTTVTSLSSNALQYGRQMLRITHILLHTSSSYTLRRVIDPSSTTDKVSDKKWLHSSLNLRIVSVASFIAVLQRLGSSALSTHSDHLTKSLMLVTGNLLEHLRSNNAAVEFQGSYWGTTQERIDLTYLCSNALTSYLSIGGGFVSIDDRRLIDSIVSTCLCALKDHTSDISSFILSSRRIKDSFLRLGMASISTPWPDGGMSSLVENLRDAASAFRYDGDSLVSSTAYSALELCSCTMTPRSPPLMIVTRTISESAGNMNPRSFLTRESLEDGIAAVNQEILKSKLVEKSPKLSKPKEVSISEALNDHKSDKIMVTNEKNIGATLDNLETELDDHENQHQAKISKEIYEEESKLMVLNDDEFDESENDATTSILLSSIEHVEIENSRPDYQTKVAQHKHSEEREKSDDDDDIESLPEIFVDGGPDEEY